MWINKIALSVSVRHDIFTNDLFLYKKNLVHLLDHVQT